MFLALVMFAALELSALAALFLIRTVFHITYHPLSTRLLSEPHRRILEDLLAGKTDYLVYSAALGWTIKPNGFAPPYRAPL